MWVEQARLVLLFDIYAFDWILYTRAFVFALLLIRKVALLIWKWTLRKTRSRTLNSRRTCRSAEWLSVEETSRPSKIAAETSSREPRTTLTCALDQCAFQPKNLASLHEDLLAVMELTPGIATRCVFTRDISTSPAQHPPSSISLTSELTQALMSASLFSPLKSENS